MSTLTLISASGSIILLALILPGAAIHAVLFLLCLLLSLFNQRTKFLLRFLVYVVIPAVSILSIFYVIYYLLFQILPVQNPWLFMSRLVIMISAAFLVFDRASTASVVLELESIGVHPLVSYVVGMSARAPYVLSGEIRESLDGFRGRGLMRIDGLRQRIQTLLRLTGSFLRLAVYNLERRALALHLKNCFERKHLVRHPEKSWEKPFRWFLLSILTLATVLQFI